MAKLDAQREALTTRVNAVSSETSAKVAALEKNVAEVAAANAAARAENAAALKAARDENAAAFKTARDENRVAIDAGFAKVEQSNAAKLDQLATRNAAANAEALAKLDTQREALSTRINGLAAETGGRVAAVEKNLAEVTAGNVAARAETKATIDAGLARIETEARQRGEAQQAQLAKGQAEAQARLDAQREALTVRVEGVAATVTSKVGTIERSVAETAAADAAARADNKLAIDAGLARLDAQLRQRGEAQTAQQTEAGQQQAARLAAVERSVAEVTAANRTATADNKAALDAGLLRLDREQNARLGEIEQKLAGSRVVDRQDVASTLRVVAEQSSKIASIEKALVDVTGAANAARSEAAQAAARAAGGTAAPPKTAATAAAAPPIVAVPAVRCDQLDETHDDVWQSALLRLAAGARLLYTDFRTGVLWAEVGGARRSYPLAEVRNAAGCP